MGKFLTRFKQDRQCTLNVTLKRVLATIVVVEENKYYVRVLCVCVALVIPHAMRMRNTVICGLPRSTLVFHIIS
jgi:hypothetical protein